MVEKPAHCHEKDIAQVQARIPAFCLIAFSPYRLCALRTYFHNQRKHRIHQRKERPEVELGEQQRTLAIKTEYMGEKFHFSSLGVRV